MEADPACPVRKSDSATRRAAMALSVTPLACREVASPFAGTVQRYIITVVMPQSAVLVTIHVAGLETVL